VTALVKNVRLFWPQVLLTAKQQLWSKDMSGHSKWSTIKRKKAAVDAKRGQIFTRLAREITIAAREGGGDPDTNLRLRLAIDKAKAGNMPKDNIERAIARGTGGDKSDELQEITYEAYAPHGVALLVRVLTDNRNRTVAEVRHVLNKQGGNLSEAGSVAWQFDRKGYIAIEPDGIDSDKVFDQAVEAGAEDVVFSDDMIEVYAELGEFRAVQEALQTSGVNFATAELSMVPKNTLQLAPDQAFKVMRVIEALEDLDDVQQVHSNLDITDELMRQYEAIA
jgi:YebC/PmpR family DNA-binding regulatory protein